MDNCSKDNALNRMRVERHRAKQTARGLERVDVYLGRDASGALYHLSQERNSSIKDTAADLIQLGLRVEGKLDAPRRFWEVILDKARRYR